MTFNFMSLKFLTVCSIVVETNNNIVISDKPFFVTGKLYTIQREAANSFDDFTQWDSAIADRYKNSCKIIFFIVNI